MSGDVGRWFCPVGILVGVFVFKAIWLELSMRLSIRVPLWSVVRECHRGWCALMSPVSIVLSLFSMWVRQVVMSLSEFAWLGFLQSRGWGFCSRVEVHTG
jgi:hypothetical protein